jgi:glutaredoxin-like YruB-family protein
MKVKIYSLPTCPHCRDLKRFLDEYHIKYVEVDISKDKNAAREMVERSGQLGVPVTDINGKIIVGFNRDALRQALGI